MPHSTQHPAPGTQHPAPGIRHPAPSTLALATLALATLALGTLALGAHAAASTKVIKAGRLIDPSGKAVANAVIVVENDRIAAVRAPGSPAAATPLPSDAEVIDLSQY